MQEAQADLLVAVAGESNKESDNASAQPGQHSVEAAQSPFRSLPRLIRASLVAAGFVTLRSSERRQRSLLWRFGSSTSRLASRWIDTFSCACFPLLVCFFRALQYVKF